jgi:hypothetical protein
VVSKMLAGITHGDVPVGAIHPKIGAVRAINTPRAQLVLGDTAPMLTHRWASFIVNVAASRHNARMSIS